MSFGKVSPQQKEEIENFGLAAYSWDEFLLLVSLHVFFHIQTKCMRIIEAIFLG